MDLRVAKHDRCADCHADAHAGQFTSRSDAGDCRTCHTISGFLPTTYTPASHAKARFPLTGLTCRSPLCKVPFRRGGSGEEHATMALGSGARLRDHVTRTSIAVSSRAGMPAASATAQQSWASLCSPMTERDFPLSGRHAARRARLLSQAFRERSGTICRNADALH